MAISAVAPSKSCNAVEAVFTWNSAFAAGGVFRGAGLANAATSCRPWSRLNYLLSFSSSSMILGLPSAVYLYPNMLSSVILLTGVPIIRCMGMSCRTRALGVVDYSFKLVKEASLTLVGVYPCFSINISDCLLNSEKLYLSPAMYGGTLTSALLGVAACSCTELPRRFSAFIPNSSADSLESALAISCCCSFSVISNFSIRDWSLLKVSYFLSMPTNCFSAHKTFEAVWFSQLKRDCCVC